MTNIYRTRFPKTIDDYDHALSRLHEKHRRPNNKKLQKIAGQAIQIAANELLQTDQTIPKTTKIPRRHNVNTRTVAIDQEEDTVELGYATERDYPIGFIHIPPVSAKRILTSPIAGVQSTKTAK